jgi:cell division protein FtsA
MDTRIGYPNEHLAGNSDEEIASPLYATAVGLLMNAIQNRGRMAATSEEEANMEEEMVLEAHEDGTLEQANGKPRKSVFEKWSEKLKDFLDNAE